MLRFALVGCGRIAQRHAQLLAEKQIAGAELVGVCDVAQDRAVDFGKKYGVPHFADMDEMQKFMDHSDDLTHDVVFERLLADMRAKGVDVAEPSDPFHDQDFIRALIATYTIAPTTDWATAAA